MKTAFIGAGPGGLAVLELCAQGKLGVLDLEVVAVVDVDPEAPGLRFAAAQGWSVATQLEDALAAPGLELVIELTGSDRVLDRIYHALPPGVRVLDHVTARVFWDVERANRRLNSKLREMTALEAQVEADRAELQEILDTIPDVVMVLDDERRICKVNRRFEELTGEPRARAEGLRCHETKACPYHGEGSTCLECGGPISEVMRTGKPATQIQYDRGIGGTQGHFQTTANPILGPDGRIRRVVQTVREITELVQLERETKKSARRFQQIVDAVHGIITIKDLDGRYQLVNPRAERMFGMREEDMVGKRAADLLPPDAAATIGAHDRAALDAGGCQVNEEELWLNGEDHILIAERFPLTDYRDEPVGLCCVARDVTPQRRLRNELIQAERLAAVGKLAAGVAHELNNPLTGILTFAEDLLLEAGGDDPLREDYEVIVGETMRCRRIVRDLLDFSRQKAPVRQRAALNVVVRRVLTMVERLASFHNVAFAEELGGDVPVVDIDPNQIHQAVLNLVTNARDAMSGTGQITIRTGRVAKGAEAFVSVTDTGCGISEEQRRRIFEPFFSTKGDQGNGLGLPAVLSVVEQHGGTVELDSTPGEGSTFRLVLPEATS